MSELSYFKLPDVGEGLTEAEIVQWKVAVGDTVAVNDIIVDIETAKSVVELPSPWAGTVGELLAEEGQTVDVGSPIIGIRTAGASAPSAAPAAESAAAAPAATAAATDALPVQEERQAVLVGYGPKTGAAKRRPRKAPSDVNGSAAPSSPTAEPAVSTPSDGPGTIPAATASATAAGPALAKPPVRKLAKDHGIDLRQLTGSGPGGIVTREDVMRAASGEDQPATEHAVTEAGSQSGWGDGARTERIPVKGVRKVTAEAMVRSAFTAPHVTEFMTVDVTRTMKLIERLRSTREFRDIKLSPMAVLARAMVVAVKRTPIVNARWDEQAGEIVLQRFVNLGIAAATPRGLIVPNVKDAHALSLPELTTSINELAGTARAGKTTPAQTTGGTISITNVGVFGVDTGTPILPPGESAIVAFGAIRQQPWVHKGKVRPRWVTTLGLSFDHRLVDGEQGSRFLADIAALLEDPALGLAWG